MAITTVQDILSDVKRFSAWTAIEAVRQSRLRQAGLIAQNSLFDERANAAGDITAIPAMQALGGVSVPGTQDGTEIDPGALSGVEMTVPRLHRNAAWSGAALVGLISGADPMAYAGTQIGEWRAREEERVCMEALKGVFAAALANDAATMVLGSATAKLDQNMVIDASQAKGERKDALDTLIVHSLVHAQLQKDNLLTTIPGSEQRVAFQVYGDKRIVISDSMPTVAAGVYASVLTSSAMFQIGDGTPPKGAIAYVEDDLKGNGSGIDTLIARRTFLLGVSGYSWNGTGNPADTALATAANYTRRIDPKLIPFVFIRSKPV